MFNKAFMAACAIALLAGCHSQPSSSQQEDSRASVAAVAEVSVAAVAQALKDKSVVPVDANGIETRQKYGVVPGAVLLSDHDDYPLSELPSDKSQALVFYCGGTLCRASDAAAARARSAGYAKVSIMREGIRGWVSAGEPIASLPKS